MIVFGTLNIAGAIIGHCIAEYVLQPSIISVTKREWKDNRKYALIAGLIHTAIWAALIAVCASIGWEHTLLNSIFLFTFAFISHFAIDCTLIPIRISDFLHIKNNGSDIELIKDNWSELVQRKLSSDMPIYVNDLISVTTDSMSMAEGIISMKLFDIGFHMLLILSMWVLF